MTPRRERKQYRKVVAVVPAAGRSRRMGRAKPLLPFGDTTLIGATVSALERGGAHAVIVVTRADDRTLIHWAKEHKIRQVENPAPHRGMLSTIQAGVAVALQLYREPTLLVSPADLPRLKAESVTQVVRALDQTGVALAVPTWRGKRGHPLAIAHRLAGEIAQLDLELGLRQLLTLHAEELVSLPTGDPGVVRDVDTPEDYARLAAQAVGEIRS